MSDDSRESQQLPLPPGAAGLVLPVPHQVSLHPRQSEVEEREDQGDCRGLQLETTGDSVGEERHPGQWEADLGQVEHSQGQHGHHHLLSLHLPEDRELQL